MGEERTGARGKPFVLWVLFGASIYVVLHVSYVVSAMFSSVLSLVGVSGVAILMVLIVALIVGAFGSLARKRWALIVEVAAALVFLGNFSSAIATALTEPGNFPAFRDAYPVSLALVLIILLSGVSLAKFKELGQSRQFSSIYSGTGLLSVAVLFLVIGGLSVAYPFSIAIGGILSNQNTPGGISIEFGSSNQGNSAGYFVPQTITVAIGANNTVAWVNHDGATHTVTSMGSTLFDSGNIPAGRKYSHTFTQAGTYEYYCTLHPWMKGTIVVTQG